jgi:hypothetical protein
MVGIHALSKTVWLFEIFICKLELCAGTGVPEPELRHILPEPELENSGKNSGRQNYEKLFYISTNIWH